MIFVAIGLLAAFCLWFTWEFLWWCAQGLRSVTPGAAAGAVPFGERPGDLAVGDSLHTATLEDMFEAQDRGAQSAVAGTMDWLLVDDNLLQAVEQRTQGTIDNGLELWTTVADRGYKPTLGLTLSDLQEQLADAGPVIGTSAGALLGKVSTANHGMEPLREARWDMARAVEQYDSTATTLIAAANATWTREVVPAIEEELAAVSADLAGQLESALGRAAAALAEAQLALQTRAAGGLRYSLVRVAARRRPLAFVAARRRSIWISQASRALAQDDAWATLDVLCALVRHDDALAPIATWSRARARALAELMDAGLRIEQEVRSTRTAAFLCLDADRQRVNAHACDETFDAAVRIWECGERVRHELIAAGARDPDLDVRKPSKNPRALLLRLIGSSGSAA